MSETTGELETQQERYERLRAHFWDKRKLQLVADRPGTRFDVYSVLDANGNPRDGLPRGVTLEYMEGWIVASTSPEEMNLRTTSQQTRATRSDT